MTNSAPYVDTFFASISFLFTVLFFGVVLLIETPGPLVATVCITAKEFHDGWKYSHNVFTNLTEKDHNTINNTFLRGGPALIDVPGQLVVPRNTKINFQAIGLPNRYWAVPSLGVSVGTGPTGVGVEETLYLPSPGIYHAGYGEMSPGSSPITVKVVPRLVYLAHLVATKGKG